MSVRDRFTIRPRRTTQTGALTRDAVDEADEPLALLGFTAPTNEGAELGGDGLVGDDGLAEQHARACDHLARLGHPVAGHPVGHIAVEPAVPDVAHIRPAHAAAALATDFDCFTFPMPFNVTSWCDHCGLRRQPIPEGAARHAATRHICKCTAETGEPFSAADTTDGNDAA